MRKTNLFYLEDNNSNFLTFSNYGEYLTGVCLSTNHKIWMSSFLCLNLPFSNDTIINENVNGDFNYNTSIGDFDYTQISRQKTIEDFKKFLMCYYENKLAVLRDYYEEDKNENIENLNTNNNVLNYLLEAIALFFGITNINDIITYFGDIVEHDYNGSYNDSICIVDFNRRKLFNVEENFSENLVFYDNVSKPLHNWNNELWDNSDAVITYHEVSDISNTNTTIKTKYNEESKVKFTTNSNNTLNDSNNISFNCIIPMFNILNADIIENVDNVTSDNDEIDDLYKYIPYGIWFSNENQDGTVNNIDLYKQNDNISQSWSLVICSKFAPYPYGVKIEDIDNDLIKTIEQYTYAELLSKHSELLTTYNQLTSKYNNLNYKVNELSKEINNLKQLNNNGINILDICNTQLTDIEQSLNDKIKTLTDNFNEVIEQLKWKAINTSRN